VIPLLSSLLYRLITVKYLGHCLVEMKGDLMPTDVSAGVVGHHHFDLFFYMDELEVFLSEKHSGQDADFDEVHDQQLADPRRSAHESQSYWPVVWHSSNHNTS